MPKAIFFSVFYSMCPPPPWLMDQKHGNWKGIKVCPKENGCINAWNRSNGQEKLQMDKRADKDR